MEIREIAAVIEEFAPLGAQAGFDNSGLIVGDPTQVVTSAMICVDATEEVMHEAIGNNAGLVISHHPVIFDGLKRLNGATQTQRVIETAITFGIGLYACHTNLDAVPGGLSYRLAEMLGVGNPRLLSVLHPGNPDVGFGVVGELAQPMPTGQFLHLVAEELNVTALRHSDIHVDKVQRVAICSGSGSSLIDAAVGAGADVYIAADFKYNNFLDVRGRTIIADVGHFESEYCAIDVLYEVIRKKLPNFALRKSENSCNPVNYLRA
ncbi:Nif3-like dinuclear metal center hexameric protein [Alistipes sp. OttesenSCG-928-B03]|nr:Nif3-like dinuclear metal center hexameric protein [Alistipes sp. OttesenSCG-928-B03]